MEVGRKRRTNVTTSGEFFTEQSEGSWGDGAGGDNIQGSGGGSDALVVVTSLDSR